MKRRPSAVFDRLVGHAQPALTHPTNTSFDLVEFARSVDLDKLSPDDVEIMASAAFFAKELKALRGGPLAAIAASLSSEDVLRLAIATVNRSIHLAGQHFRAELRKGGKRGGEGHISALAAQPLTGAGSDLSADDVATTVIDALPHWFAVAKASRERETVTPTELAELPKIQIVAEEAVTIERSLRDLWLQSLWEPWSIASDVFAPSSLEDAARWTAWQHREDTLSQQLRNLDMVIGETHAASPAVLVEVVKEARPKPGGRYKFTYGRESARTHTLLHQMNEALEASYLRPFLDLDLPKTGCTVRQACHAWLGLVVLGREIRKTITNWEFDHPSDLLRMSIPLARTEIVECVRRATSLQRETCETLTTLFTCDPSDLNSAFSQGLWHRPLVALSGGKQVLFAAGIVGMANLIYVVERLLHATGLARKIAKRSLGLGYETHLRTAIGDAVQSNAIIRDTSSVARPIKKTGQTGEEIDLVLKIGRTVLVGEIKCFVRPTGSIERYNHLTHLEDAAEQAARKRDWLRANPDVLRTALSLPDLDTDGLRMLPVVVVNNSAGLGLQFGDVFVSDAHWLKLLLSSGAYTSGGQRDNRTGEISMHQTTVYRSSAELQDRLVQLLAKPPGLQKFLNAIEWRTRRFPKHDGSWFEIADPILSNEKMVAAER